jgi:hypothetical protein
MSRRRSFDLRPLVSNEPSRSPAAQSLSIDWPIDCYRRADVCNAGAALQWLMMSGRIVNGGNSTYVRN